MDLTHWGRVTHIGLIKLIIIGSDNAGILLIGPLGTNLSGILIKIQTFSFKKKRLKVSSAKWRPFCLGLNVLMPWGQSTRTTILQVTFAKVFSWKNLVFWLKFILNFPWYVIENTSACSVYPLKLQSDKYIHEPNFVFIVPTQTPTASRSARPLAGTEPNCKFVWFLASFAGILPFVLYFVDRAWRY